MPAVSQSVPRLSLLVVSIILTLRDQGQSYRDIAKNPRVRKADGSTLSQQGARYVAKKYPRARRAGLTNQPASGPTGKVAAGA